MKIPATSLMKLCACLLISMAACKQEYIEGVKSDPDQTVKVYFPDASKTKGLVPALTASKLTVDPIAKTANLAVPVYRGGSSGLEGFTVDVTVDNSNIAALIQSGDLPANTVILDPASFTLQTKDSVTYSNHIMKGFVVPKIKIASLNQYGGKTAAIGLKLTGSSKHEINSEMNKVILYFSVEDMIDEVTPKTNMVDKTKWEALRIANNTNVTFTVNPDGSILAAGGNGGHAAVFQSFEVRANKKYKVDMKVAGSGATDTWYEVYVGTAVPIQGSDYSDGQTRLGLNTWTGCGKTTFDGQLSAIACTGAGKGVVTFANTGTVYLVIKSGGSNLGTTGIKASAIEFKRYD